MPAYDKLTNEYAEWLIDSKNPLIDRHDWGEWNQRQQRPLYSATNAHLEVWYERLAYPPQKLTRTTLKSHLGRRNKLYYTSSRKSGFALVCIDIDAHDGQTDSFDAAMFVRTRYFPLAYLEPSRRGFHLYVLVRVGRCRRWKFNVLLGHLEANLRAVFVENHFESTVEVLGGFTIVQKYGTIQRADLAPMPELPNGSADLKWLKEMPVYLIDALFAVRYDADLAREMAVHDDDGEQRPTRTHRRTPTHDSACAWDRMQWACFEFTVQCRRLPDLEELLAFYRHTYATDAGEQRRRRRAEFAIKYRMKTFDIAKANFDHAKQNALALRLLLHRLSSHSDEGLVQGIIDEPALVAIDRVFSDAIDYLSRRPSMEPTSRQKLTTLTFSMMPWIDFRLGDGLRMLAALSRRDVMPVACWSVRQALSLLPRHSPAANRLRHLTEVVERLAADPAADREIAGLAVAIKTCSGAFGGHVNDTSGDGMIGVFGGFVEKWPELVVVDDTGWHHGWWHWVVDVARMSANAGQASGADHSQWHDDFGLRIRLQIGEVLQRQMTVGATVRASHGSPEALAVFPSGSDASLVDSHLEQFRFRVGEIRRSGTGKLRTIAGLGFNSTHEGAYCVYCHDDGALVLKRAHKAHAEYGLLLGWDDALLAKCQS